MITAPDSPVYRDPRVLDFAEAAATIARLVASGRRVGLCHGGFDLLHPGHLAHFAAAKRECDILVVSVTADRFVSARKGQHRPVIGEALRAFAISQVRVVDYVVISDFELGVETIEALRPSVYIKGPDYRDKVTPGIVAEREAIERVGGSIVFTREPALSTSDIIAHIRGR